MFLLNVNAKLRLVSTKRSAGVAPEVNPLHVGSKTHNKRSTLALKPRGDVTRSPKSRYQWPQEKPSDGSTQGRCHPKSKSGVSAAPQKGLVSSKNF